MKLGIENLKTVLGFAINLSEAVEKAADNGKITLWEGIGLARNLKDLPGIINNAKFIRDEYNDLDDKERRELEIFIETELELKNENLENIIETALIVITNVSRLSELKKAA